MAEQTGQHGYLSGFDRVNATALHMRFQLHPGMISVQVDRISRGSKGYPKCPVSGSFHTPRNPRGREDNPEAP